MEYTFGTIADIPALIDMRTAYILEDFGKLSPEDEAVMRKTLPGLLFRAFKSGLHCISGKGWGNGCFRGIADDSAKALSSKNDSWKDGRSPQRVYAALLIADRALHSTICNDWLIMRESAGWIM